MPSSISFSSTTTPQSKHSIYRKPAKKPMSLTSVYFLAHSARGKLSKEAQRADHDLRLLVGHANMLDSLMIDLANAEQEQERWFNQSVSESEEQPEQWGQTVTEEPEEEEDSMDEEEDFEEETKPETVITTTEIDSDDEENYGDLALTRTHSRHSPPELSSDSDSDSEDEHMPSSPPQSTLITFTEKQRQAIATTSYYDAKDASLSSTEQESFEEAGFFLPSRQQPIQIAAY